MPVVSDFPSRYRTGDDDIDARHVVDAHDLRAGGVDRHRDDLFGFRRAGTHAVWP